jgi:hypothetical protein
VEGEHDLLMIAATSLSGVGWRLSSQALRM